MNDALGFLEMRSLTGVIDATDAMTKAANVKLVGTVKIGSGLVNVVIRGDVDAVKAALEAGETAAKKIGDVYAVHIIPRPGEAIEKILPSFY